MLQTTELETIDVLVLAPVGRDGEIARKILQGAQISARVCRTLDEAVSSLESALCLVVTEEALLSADRRGLAEFIEKQPPWSDYPVLLLVAAGADVDPRLAFLDPSLSVLERPFRQSTLIKAVRSAMRARRRQLEVKAYIDERVQVAERQQLLIRELHHRVKNTLANVQALLGATARSAHSVDEFYSSFSSRIVSLAQTHTMLTDDYWQMASLRGILEKELAHYDSFDDDRLRLEGPPVDLVADIAVPLGMGFHELATNSAKYGSLSVPEGRLSVTWSLHYEEGRHWLLLSWVESGGPPVSQPIGKGFGTVLLERVLAVQCEAQLDIDYRPEGFRLDMRLPLKAARLVPNY